MLRLGDVSHRGQVACTAQDTHEFGQERRSAVRTLNLRSVSINRHQRFCTQYERFALVVVESICISSFLLALLHYLLRFGPQLRVLA